MKLKRCAPDRPKRLFLGSIFGWLGVPQAFLSVRGDVKDLLDKSASLEASDVNIRNRIGWDWTQKDLEFLLLILLKFLSVDSACFGSTSNWFWLLRSWSNGKVSIVDSSYARD